MLKKSLFIGAAAIALALTSCGEKKSAICECLDLTVQMMEESKDLDFNDPKVQEIREKYKADEERCEKVMEEFQAQFDGLSDEEMQAKQVEEFEKCPSYARIQEIMDEQMKAFEEAMGNMELEDMDMDFDMEEMDADIDVTTDEEVTE